MVSSSSEFVGQSYPFLMTSTLFMSFVQSFNVYVVARLWGRKSHANPKCSTGNCIVDFLYGPEMNLYYMSIDVKLTDYRVSMKSVLNVKESCCKTNSAFKIVYAMNSSSFRRQP